MKDQLVLACLKCPCGSPVAEESSGVTCTACHRQFRAASGALDFMGSAHKMQADSGGDSLVLRLKLFLKRYPWLFSSIHAWIAGPTIGLSPRAFASRLGGQSLVLNLGSGTRRIAPNVVNVDYYLFENVDIAADIYALPFRDSSVDGILCNSVLEHLPEPQRAIEEIKRILKPGGQAYIQTPFMHSFHSSPDDFYRWTHVGLRKLFNGFDTEATQTVYGPTSTLVHSFSEWAALVGSFGSGLVYQALNLGLQFLLGPLRLLDLVLARHSRAIQSAHILSLVATKR